MRQSPALPVVCVLGLLVLQAVPAASAEPAGAVHKAPGGAVQTAPAESLRTGEILPRLACRDRPEQTYALYLPARYVPGKPLPIVYLFDARQRGAFAAERFRAAAEELGMIVASSNVSRSDGPWAPNLETMKAMWEDTHARFAIDPSRVYASGYSGGARTATLLAISRPGEVAGVIACGGGFPVDRPPAPATSFAFFGAAGRRDFNYSELRKLDLALAELGKAHRFEVFDGGHEWCPSALATQALRWMTLLAMRDGVIPRVAELIESEWRDQLAAAEALAQQGESVRAGRRYQEIARDFTGLRDVAGAVNAARRLEATPEHRAAVSVEESAEREAEEYGPEAARILHDAFADVDAARLPVLLKKLRVPALKQRAAGEGYPAQAAQRLLEVLYVQTVYYIPGEFEKQKDYARAALSLRVATEVKPDQPWAWFGLAAALAPEGDTRGALAALAKAIDLGFDDAAAFASEPGLERVRGSAAFRELAERLKRRAAPG